MNKKTISLATILITMPLVAFAIVSPTTRHRLFGWRTLEVKQTSEDAATRYRERLTQIRESKKKRDLKGLEQIADEIQSQYPSLGSAYYTDLMIEVIGAMSGYQFKDDRQYLLAIKYAKATLEKPDQLTVEGEAKIAQFLEGGPEYDTGQMKPDQWVQDRRERTNYWLHAWRRFEREINRNFDFDTRPPLNISPPSGYGPAGIAPESIKDPAARAQYEAALARNKQRIAEYNRQWQLRQLDKSFTPSMRRFLIEAYSKTPHNIEELDHYLDAYGMDQRSKQMILAAVSQDVSGNPH